MRILRALFRILANHMPEPNIRHIFFLFSGIKYGTDSFINMGLNLVDDYRGGLIIGKRVAISPNVTVIVCSYPNKSMLSQISELSKFKTVVIENDAWIGSGAIILPGIKIGKMSIVAAGSIVTKDVPEFSVVAGNPAKIIRRISTKDFKMYPSE